jgi:HAD superfamily hydrolase (TIGR01509 family)
VKLQLGKVGILDAFGAHVFSGQDMPNTKPHPDVYLAAAAALGVDPKRCAVIEDTVTGATAGVAAGATVFGFSGRPAPQYAGGCALRARK